MNGVGTLNTFFDTFTDIKNGKIVFNSIDDVINLGISSVDDLAKIGIKNKDDLAKLGIHSKIFDKLSIISRPRSNS